MLANSCRSACGERGAGANPKANSQVAAVATGLQILGVQAAGGGLQGLELGGGRVGAASGDGRRAVGLGHREEAVHGIEVDGAYRQHKRVRGAREAVDGGWDTGLGRPRRWMSGGWVVGGAGLAAMMPCSVACAK